MSSMEVCESEERSTSIEQICNKLIKTVSTELEHLVFTGINKRYATMSVLKRLDIDMKPPPLSDIHLFQDQFPFLSPEQVIISLFVQQEIKRLHSAHGNFQKAADILISRFNSRPARYDVPVLKRLWESIFKLNEEKKKKVKVKRKAPAEDVIKFKKEDLGNGKQSSSTSLGVQTRRRKRMKTERLLEIKK